MHAKLDVIGSRIWLRTSQPAPGLGKRVRGAGWRKVEKCWTFPLRLDVCRMLRESLEADYAAKLEILPRLWAWAAEAKAEEMRLAHLGVSPAQDSSAVPLLRIPQRWPIMAAALAARPYQSRAVRFVAEGRQVLLADTPGLGKTLESIAGILESGVKGPYLVVAPGDLVMEVWKREIQHYAPDQNVTVVKGSYAARVRLIEDALMKPRSWIIINPEMLRTTVWWVCPECKERWRATARPKSSAVDCEHASDKARTVYEHHHPSLFRPEFGAVVMDECHNSLVRRSAQQTQVRWGATKLQVRADGIKIAASGTPMRGKSHQIWGTLNWLRPKEYPGFWAWAESYYYTEKASQFGGVTIGNLRPERQDMLDKALSGIMLRRTKAEVSPDLPAKQYMDSKVPGLPEAIWLPLLPEQERAYKEMVRAGSADIKGGRVETVGMLAELTRLKQFASAYGRWTKKGKFKPSLPSNKFEWLVQFLTELGIVDGDGTQNESKVVVVSQFTSVLRAFAEALMEMGVEVCGVTGKITGKRRIETVDRFNAPGGPRVLFLQIKSGGVGITLDAADDMVILDETWVPDDQEQAEDRINNRRPEEKVAKRRYWYLKSLGTVDEGIAAVNSKADRAQKGLLDGRRGVEFTRAVKHYMESRVA